MRQHYLIIGAILGLGIVMAFFIVITAPNSNNTSSGLATPTPDPSESLSGGNIDGQLAFSRQGALWIWHGSKASRLLIDAGKSVIANGLVKLIQPALSPDGSKIAYVRQDETFADLWIADNTGKSARALSASRGKGTPRTSAFVGSSLWTFHPAWSPIGNSLAFLTDIGTDDLALWLTDPAKFNPRRLSNTLAIGQGGLQHPTWSPNGEYLAVSAYEAGKSQIYVIKASNGIANKITDRPESAYDPAWSPNDNFISFVARKGTSSELWLMQTNGGGAVMLSNIASRSPVWSPDGRKIAFLGLKDNAFEIYIIELTTQGTAAGSPKQLSSNLRLDGTGGLSWSR